DRPVSRTDDEPRGPAAPPDGVVYERDAAGQGLGRAPLAQIARLEASAPDERLRGGGTNASSSDAESEAGRQHEPARSSMGREGADDSTVGTLRFAAIPRSRAAGLPGRALGAFGADDPQARLVELCVEGRDDVRVE